MLRGPRLIAVLFAVAVVVQVQAELPPSTPQHRAYVVALMLVAGAALVAASRRPRLELLVLAAAASVALPGRPHPPRGEVLRLIAAGLSNQEISARLFVSEATVKTHINNIFSKGDLRDRGQAVAYAFRHGLAANPDAR